MQPDYSPYERPRPAPARPLETYGSIAPTETRPTATLPDAVLADASLEAHPAPTQPQNQIADISSPQAQTSYLPDASSIEPQAVQPDPTPPDIGGADPEFRVGDNLNKKQAFKFNKTAFLITAGGLAVVVLVAMAGLIFFRSNDKGKQLSAGEYSVGNVPIGQLTQSNLEVGRADSLTVNGELKLDRGLVLAESSLPLNPQLGQIYLNSEDKRIYYYNGTEFVDLATSDSTRLTAGAGIALNDQTVTNTGVTSIQGVAGQITVNQTTGDVTVGLPNLPSGQLLLGGGTGALGSVANGQAGHCLLANGSGAAPSFQACPNAGINGSGTAGSLAKFSSSGVITDSILSESGSTATVAGSLVVNTAAGGNVALLNSPQTFTGVNLFKPASNSINALHVQNSASATVFSVDTVNGRVGVGGAGPGYTLDVQGGDINVSGMYRVNGSQISSANLSNDANLAKINGANVFSAANTFGSSVAIQGANSLTLGTASNLGSIIFRDGSSANTASLALAGALGANATFRLPVASGTQSLCTVELGNCAGSGSGVTGSGTANKLAKFSAAQNIVDSSITDDGATVTVAVGQVIQGTSGLTIGTTGVNGQLVFKNSSNANTLTLQSGVTTGNLTLTLPTGDGSNGNCLKTNGAGALAFAACTGGPGGGVTSVNALSGTLNLVGTANQINVSSAGDTITLSLPQDITTGGNVTFRTITLNGTAVGDNLITGNAVAGATGTLLDLKVNSVSKLVVDANGNVNSAGQFQINGSQISSANLSNDANLAKLNGTGPQTFTGNNRFNGTLLVQNAANSTTAVQIQNAAGTSNLFNADTTNSRIGVGTAAPGYTLDVNGDINTTGVYRINGVTVCSASSCTAAAGSNNYIQNGTSPQTADFNVTGGGTIGGVLTVDRGLFKNAANSTTAVQIQNAAGTNLLIVDTTNGRLSIGPSSVPANGVLTIGTNTNTNSGGLYLGTDTYLYRSAAQQLSTNGQVRASLGFLSYPATSGQAYIGDIGGARGGITLGLSEDTNLYRTAADTLKTDDSLIVAGGLQPASVATNGTAANASLTVSSAKGGNTTGTTGQLAGTGGAISLTAGAGGDAPAGSTNGNGGNITLQGGSPGAGLGTAGNYGNLLLQSSGGNVGIGTASPSSTLDVRGNARIYDTANLQGIDIITSINRGSLTSKPALLCNTSCFLGADGTNDLHLGTNNSSNIVIKNGGNVLIGTSTNNTGLLQLASGTTPANGIGFGSDVNLYRSAADQLKTDDSLSALRYTAVPTLSTNQAFMSVVGANSFESFLISGGGQLNWGSGAAATDTNLYRSAADILKTDDLLDASPRGVVTYNVAGAPAPAWAANGMLAVDNTNNRLYFVAGGNWRYAVDSTPSDARLKKNIVTSSGDALEKVLQAEVVDFQYNGNPAGGVDDGSVHTGLIAQQIQSLIPEAVTEIRSIDPNGTTYLSVDYTKFTPYLIKAIQQQQGQINSLADSGAMRGEFADLNVSGAATINNLTVTGTARLSSLEVSGPATLSALTVTGSAQFSGDITVGGHIITAGGQPSSQVLTAAGGGATVTVTGNDTSGTILITTGDAPTAGELVRFVFSKSYGASPKVLISPSNESAAGLRSYRGSTSLTDFVWNSKDAPAPRTTYQFDYFITQ